MACGNGRGLGRGDASQGAGPQKKGWSLCQGGEVIQCVGGGGAYWKGAWLAAEGRGLPSWPLSGHLPPSSPSPPLPLPALLWAPSHLLAPPLPPGGGGGGLKGGGDPQRDPRNEGGDPKKPHRDPMGPRDPMRTPKLNLWGHEDPKRPHGDPTETLWGQGTPWRPPN